MKCALPLAKANERSVRISSWPITTSPMGRQRWIYSATPLNLLIFFCTPNPTNVTINHCPLRREVAPQHFHTEPLILEHSKNINPRRMFSPKKITPAKYSLLKNIQSWKKFTPEKYSLLKNIHSWKNSLLKNIHP